jgi:hypothetical protein
MTHDLVLEINMCTMQWFHKRLRYIVEYYKENNHRLNGDNIVVDNTISTSRKSSFIADLLSLPQNHWKKISV